MDNEVTRKIISKLNNNLAMGPDGLPIQVYKYSDKIMVEAINDIPQDVLETGVIP